MGDGSESRSGGPGIGNYETWRLSFLRRLAIAGFEAIPAGHYMTAIQEINVTLARNKIRAKNTSGSGCLVSFFSYCLKAIAMALSENRGLNCISSGSKIFKFEDVDINIPIETQTGNGEYFPRQLSIRNADKKTVEDIYVEIEAAKKEYSRGDSLGPEDKKAVGLMRIFLAVPRVLRKALIRRLAGNPLMVKKMSGTVFVTTVQSVSPGFAIPYIAGPRALAVAVGSVAKKPVCAENGIMAGDILHLTLCFNHDIVDGAPAARFTSCLVKIMEHAQYL